MRIFFFASTALISNWRIISVNKISWNKGHWKVNKNRSINQQSKQKVSFQKCSMQKIIRKRDQNSQYEFFPQDHFTKYSWLFYKSQMKIKSDRNYSDFLYNAKWRAVWCHGDLIFLDMIYNQGSVMKHDHPSRLESWSFHCTKHHNWIVIGYILNAKVSVKLPNTGISLSFSVWSMIVFKAISVKLNIPQLFLSSYKGKRSYTEMRVLYYWIGCFNVPKV